MGMVKLKKKRASEMNATTKKQNIRNPELWVNKYVRHMANWQDFQWGDADNRYVVCEWTGKLIRIEDEAQPQFEDRELLSQFRWFSECYYYSSEAITDMVKYAGGISPFFISPA